MLFLLLVVARQGVALYHTQTNGKHVGQDFSYSTRSVRGRIQKSVVGADTVPAPPTGGAKRMTAEEFLESWDYGKPAPEPAPPAPQRRAVPPPDGVPEDFDASTYLRMHPDLVAAGLSGEQAARSHFEHHGRLEGRPYKLPRVYVQYATCTEHLAEQLYAHVAATALAHGLRAARLVVAPLLPAGSSGDAAAHAPAGVFDLQEMTQRWESDEQAPMKLEAATTLLAPAGMVDGNASLPPFRQPAVDDDALVAGPGLYRKLLPLSGTLDELYSLIASKLMAAGAGFDAGFEVLLQLPCPFFALRFDSCYDVLANTVLPRLAFNDHVAAVAAAARMRLGGSSYNGLVLSDAGGSSGDAGRLSGAARDAYVAALNSSFGRQLPCYVAVEGGQARAPVMKQLSGALVGSNMCRSLKAGRDVVGARALSQLTAPQRQLLDLLVLLDARQLAGSRKSLLTLLLRELRYVRDGVPRSAVTFLDDGAASEYTLQQLHYGAMLAQPEEADSQGVELLSES